MSEPQQAPHSRACGWRAHPHGPECHTNCPTCGGKGTPPAVTADALTGPIQLDTSVMVELCRLRPCPWTSADTRATTTEERDDAARRHLLAEHRPELEYLWTVLESGS